MKAKAKPASRPATTTDDHDPIDSYVGKRLRLRRQLLGLSQSRLGEMNDLTFQQIQKYESGANRISAGRLYRLAKMLGVEITYFYENMPHNLTPDPRETPSNGIDIILGDKETLELMRAFQRVGSADQRKRFLKLLQSMGVSQQTNKEE